MLLACKFYNAGKTSLKKNGECQLQQNFDYLYFVKKKRQQNIKLTLCVYFALQKFLPLIIFILIQK